MLFRFDTKTIITQVCLLQSLSVYSIPKCGGSSVESTEGKDPSSSHGKESEGKCGQSFKYFYPQK